MSLDTSQTVFVTGGSGYIGRNVLRAFAEAGQRVKALARSAASADVVSKLGAEPVLGDLSDSEALRAGMSGSGYLIHAAAVVARIRGHLSPIGFLGRCRDFRRCVACVRSVDSGPSNPNRAGVKKGRPL